MINIKAEKGFSLVEVMVAMAVLLIIVIAFSTLFTFAFGGIFSQGRKSEALYEEVQKELEELYETGNSDGTDELVIGFVNASSTISVTGAIVTEPYTYDDRTNNIYTFIPD